MFTFLNSSMAGATSRFLTYEIGQNNPVRLNETFISAFTLHCAIAFVIFLAAETFGLWFLTHKLVIPEDRLYAAHWVYQLSILVMVISVTQVPYNACIISHEKMQIYAYVEILNSILKLAIVNVLIFWKADKLILYAILILLVTTLIAMIYRGYCIHNFSECKLRIVWKPNILKPMLIFSGWDIYGNMSTLARTQGVNMMLNIFFGPALNAASSIATQVQGAVMSFAANVLTASKPQIIKQYAQGHNDEMISLIRNTLRLNVLLLFIISLPLLIEMEFILKVWLGEVPAYASIFCIFTLLFNLFASISSILVTGIHATGYIKRPSLINGSLYLLVLPVTYFLYKYGVSPWSSYLFNVIAVFIGMLSNAYTLQIYVPKFRMHIFIVKDLLPILAIFTGVYIWGSIFQYNMQESWMRLFLTCMLTTSLLLILGYLFLIPASLKNKIKTITKNKLCRKV